MNVQIWIGVGGFLLVVGGAVIGITRAFNTVAVKVDTVASEQTKGFQRIDGRLTAQDITTAGHAEKLTKVMTVLTGIDGQNGINGEVRALKETTRANADLLHNALGRLALIDANIPAGTLLHLHRRENDR